MRGLSEYFVYNPRLHRTYIGYQPTSGEPAVARTIWAVQSTVQLRGFLLIEHRIVLTGQVAFRVVTAHVDWSGFEHGFAGIKTWLLHKPETEEDLELFADLVLEFRRWKKGCPDTPSVPTALHQAGLEAESGAIKRADYSMTSWLEDIVGPMGKSRRLDDKSMSAEIRSKAAYRKSRKGAVETHGGNDYHEIRGP